MWILDKADGAANLLSIVFLLNWQVMEYIDKSDIDDGYQYIPYAIKAVLATLLGVVGCISFSKLRSSAFILTESQLFSRDEIESQRSTQVS